MFESSQYQLLDFGHGRKLERFGRYTLERPCPAANSARQMPEKWSQVAANYTRTTSGKGSWTTAPGFPPAWSVRVSDMVIQLRLTDSGHLGLFPEQMENWRFIRRAIRNSKSTPKLLNAFAYTGGSTLAAAMEGAKVVHLDASRSVVNWARQNASQSNLHDAKVRWIVDDARKFVEREIRRGNRYQALVLDPPSYGHGPNGNAWKIDEHLAPFLANCVRLLDDHPLFIVFTCHTAGMKPADLETLMHDAGFSFEAGDHRTRQMSLRSADGRHLEAGLAFLWSSERMV